MPIQYYDRSTICFVFTNMVIVNIIGITKYNRWSPALFACDCAEHMRNKYRYNTFLRLIELFMRASDYVLHYCQLLIILAQNWRSKCYAEDVISRHDLRDNTDSMPLFFLKHLWKMYKRMCNTITVKAKILCNSMDMSALWPYAH